MLWRLVYLIPFILLACDRSPEEELPVGETEMVIQGWITDQPGPHTVVVSTTAPYNNNQSTPKISGAQLSISADDGSVYLLTESADPGVYHTHDTVRGTAGRYYTLQVITPEGRRYQSFPELLPPVPGIDGLTLQPETQPDETEGCLLSVRLTDPMNQANQYRWKVSINNELQDLPADMRLGTDEYVDGSPVIVELGFYQSESLDVFRVEQLSLSSPAHDYLLNITNQALGLGTIFSPAASSVTGNMLNPDNPQEKVLGYFGASSVTVASVTK